MSTLIYYFVVLSLHLNKPIIGVENYCAVEQTRLECNYETKSACLNYNKECIEHDN